MMSDQTLVSDQNQVLAWTQVSARTLVSAQTLVSDQTQVLARTQVSAQTLVLAEPLPHLEEEGVGVVSQLAEQSLLDFGVGQLFLVLQFWINLPGHHKQVPPKGHAHHIHVLPTVAKRT